MSSVVIKSIDRDRVRAAMDAYAAHLLSTKPDVEEIVVFGSFERGDYCPGSDLDVFILLSRSDISVRDRLPDMLPAVFPVAVDLFPYTRDEVSRLAPSPILDAVDGSRWRYRRTSD